MNLDNEPLALGDVVFDVSASRGQGRVVEIFESAGRVEVVFINKLRVRYNDKGIQDGGGHKSLSWSNPFDLITPMKDAPFRALQKQHADLFRSAILAARAST